MQWDNLQTSLFYNVGSEEQCVKSYHYIKLVLESEALLTKSIQVLKVWSTSAGLEIERTRNQASCGHFLQCGGMWGQLAHCCSSFARYGLGESSAYVSGDGRR